MEDLSDNESLEENSTHPSDSQKKRNYKLPRKARKFTRNARKKEVKKKRSASIALLDDDEDDAAATVQEDTEESPREPLRRISPNSAKLPTPKRVCQTPHAAKEGKDRQYIWQGLPVWQDT